MKNRIRLVLAASLILAVILSFADIPIVSSQGLTIIAREISDPLPVNDPNSALWQEATAVEIVLSGQNITAPMSSIASVRTLTTRALWNDEQISILVEWEDETLNDQVVRPQDFRDSLALQFPLVENQPFFCMGQQNGNVNVWHWKADWQADMLSRQDMETIYPNMYVDYYPFTTTENAESVALDEYDDQNYLTATAAGNLLASAERSSSVEDLIAGGFGTLTSQPADQQNVQGFGHWENGKWRVIFTRSVSSPESEDMNFIPGNIHSIAFAAWDGDNEERNGQKATSQWVSLSLGPETSQVIRTSRSGPPAGVWMAALLLFTIAVTVFFIKIFRENAT